MSFLRRSSAKKRPGSPESDLAAIAQLRQAGADLTVPHRTRHFIYVPGGLPAQHLARALKTPERNIDIDTSARKGYWLVVVGQFMMVQQDTLAALRAEFEAAAKPFGGQYDSWQVDLAGG